MTQSDIDKILELIHNKNKLLAVKELTEIAKISLKDATNIINDFTLGKETDLKASVERVKGIFSQENNTISAGREISQSKIDEILALIHKGSKLAAVKVLMDASDLGLKEAKDIIDGIAAGEQKELNTAIKQAKSRYTDNYESISATCDPDGSNVRFFYQKGTIKEEVTPGHPMWQRVKNHYGIQWEGAPEDILKAREPFLKAVQEMEAQSAIHLEKENTLFIKDDNMIDGLKWYFIIFLILCAILYFVFK